MTQALMLNQGLSSSVLKLIMFCQKNTNQDMSHKTQQHENMTPCSTIAQGRLDVKYYKEQLEKYVKNHMHKVKQLLNILPSNFTFREFLQIAGYEDIKELNRGMRARITRAIPLRYRTDKKRDGLRLYFKQTNQDFDDTSYIISTLIEWLEELKTYHWIDAFSY